MRDNKRIPAVPWNYQLESDGSTSNNIFLDMQKYFFFYIKLCRWTFSRHGLVLKDKYSQRSHRKINISGKFWNLPVVIINVVQNTSETQEVNFLFKEAGYSCISTYVSCFFKFFFRFYINESTGIISTYNPIYLQSDLRTSDLLDLLTYFLVIRSTIGKLEK